MYLMGSSDAFSVRASLMCPRFLLFKLSCLSPCTLMRGQSWWSYHTGSDKGSPEVSQLLSVWDRVFLDHACLSSHRTRWLGQGPVGGTGKALDLKVSPMTVLALWPSSL